MRVLEFEGRVTSKDKEPLYCREEVAIATKVVVFKSYPLSILDIKMNMSGIEIDGVGYKWETFPITIHRGAKHSTKYREIVEESITINVSFK